MARNNRERPFTISEEDCKKLEAKFAEEHHNYTVHYHSMCIFKRKRSLRCNHGEEKRYKVTLDAVSFRDEDTNEETTYWSIDYFINDEPFDFEKHTNMELMMMYGWVEERKEHFEEYGEKIVLWRY